MKRTILMLAVMLMPIVAMQAQDLLLGGTVAFDFTKSESTMKATTTTTVEGPTETYFDISPFAGYFLNENFVVGLGIGYQSEVYKETDISMGTITIDEYKVSHSLMSIYPFARYYYLPTKNAGVFLEGSFGVGFGKNKEETKVGSVTESEEVDIFGVAFGITPGIVIYVTDYLGLEASFGGLEYASYSMKQEIDKVNMEWKGSSLSFAFNPDFFKFGVVVKLGD